MVILRTLVSNYREVIGTVSKYSTHLPPHARYRLASWLVFEAIIRKPGLPPAGKQIPGRVQQRIEQQVALFAGYMVLFAHDDAVDKFNFGTAQIYAQLSRYLSAFLMGLSTDEGSSTAGKLSQELRRWSARLHKSLRDSPDIVAELHYLLVPPSDLAGQQVDGRFTIQDLLFRDEYEQPGRDWLNASIVSALGMGRAFREILRLLERHLAEDKAGLEARCEFFMNILVRCMYAQAHSPEQKDPDAIRYDRFIELSYLKSTILMDLINYVSDLVNEQRFFATRHNASRACDQIFDDLRDFDEDTADRILGILHVHILEQGRLAEKFLSLPDRQTLTISTVRELLVDTKILRTTYDDTFIYHNPYVQAARDPCGDLCMGPDEAETILRELWVNSPGELNWPIERLALQRSSLSTSFKDAWRAKNLSAALDIIHRSNFPIALLDSLSHFVYGNKKVIIEAYTQHGARKAGYVGYFTVTLGLKALRINFWIKRTLRLLLSPRKNLLDLKRGPHEKFNPT
jgi:hypothetical protein